VAQKDPNPRVLLVEDDRAGRLLYAEWLVHAGFHVAQAHNGLQALERAFDARPDVVVTRRLKQDPRTRDVPVLAVTGYAAFASDPARARRAGCDAVLPKPCSAEDLESAIRNLIDESRRSRQA
jgi:two-component system cell cycle response regulator DivK